MFERQQELEAAQGYRGPATRSFGPIEPNPNALVSLREMCMVVLGLAGLQVLLGLRTVPAIGCVLGAAIGLPAVVLLLTKQRFVGFGMLLWYLLLFALCVLFATPRGLLAIALWVLLAFASIRASRAAVMHHRFRSPAAISIEESSATPPPSGA